MRKFICELRENVGGGSITGCVVTLDKNGISVYHLFFSNLETIPYESIVKIIQFKNRWIELKVEYNTRMGKKELLRLRVLRKKAFVAYASHLGLEVETQERFQ